MLLVQGDKITFKYEGQDSNLLEDISFVINSSTKAGLVGKNGCGKTTLFKILLKEFQDYHGHLSFDSCSEIGYLPQELRFNENISGFEYLWKLNENLWYLKNQIDEICRNEEIIVDIEIFSRYEELGGYDFEIKLEKLLLKFGFNTQMLLMPISSLSGGEKTKLALLRIILTEPDLLLMDEPTNHLDVATLNWLERYLQEIDIPFLIISHDRVFLDKCVKQIWEIADRKLQIFSGNYSFYHNKKEEERQTQIEKYYQQQKKIKQLKRATEQRRVDADRWENFKLPRSVKKNGGICKRDDGSGSSRADPKKMMRSAKALEKRMEMMIEKEQAEMPRLDKKRKVRFSSDNKAKSKVVLSIENLTKRFTGDVFPPVNLSVKRGSRVAIVGKNGCGKSTLLKIITGFEQASTGSVYFPPSVSFAYYAQEYENLNFENTILEEIIGDDLSNQAVARTILGCIGIERDKVFQKIKTLSIGERSKVALVKTILSGANVLILDEPTNHLEIAAKEVIENALTEFPGTIIFTSHDRMFLNKIADKVFDLETCEMHE